jgi:hypothetical protein
MKISLFAGIALLLSSATVVAAANTKSDADTNNAKTTEFVKGNMPCLGGTCIGDDISTLGNIHWNDSKAINKDLKYTNAFAAKQKWIRFIPGANSDDVLREALPYIIKGFDNAGIEKLANLKGFCSRNTSLKGTYKSDSGFDTTVMVTIFSAVFPALPRYRVSSIQRVYPTNYTEAQQVELKRQFKERYAGIPDETYQAKHNNKEPEAIWSLNGTNLELRALPDFIGSESKFNEYPGCGQALKID